jgi:hypothetical protein
VLLLLLLLLLLLVLLLRHESVEGMTAATALAT